MEEELILMKLGGSVITEKDQPFTERMDVIKRISREIHEARQEKNLKLIVGHGGGSYPHVPASQFQTHKGIINEESYRGIVEVQDAAAKLNRIIVKQLLDEGENAVSIQLSACCIAENDRIKEMYLKPVQKFLEFNVIPVPHGDVALDLKKGCTILSTEEVLNFLAKNKKKFFPQNKLNRIIVCGRVDGVFTGDPTNPESQLVPTITPKNVEKIRDYLAESSGIDVTGGMVHKVNRMLELSSKGIQTEIINALKPGYVKRALLGEKNLGTVIKK
jgi:isopentenyl phosphate kinase